MRIKERLIKNAIIVLAISFFITLPFFSLAQSSYQQQIDSGKQALIEELQAKVQLLQAQIKEIRFKLLEIIEQRISEVKKEIEEIQQELEIKIKTGEASSQEEKILPEQEEQPTQEQKQQEESLQEESQEETEASEEFTPIEKKENFSGGFFPSPIPISSPSEEPEDNLSPSEITDLSASNPTINSITLSWTAPGDDADSGTAASYDIRYSTSPIDESNWDSADQVTGEPTPLLAGSAQSMTVSGLTSGTTYYFAIKASDEVGNVSLLSNVASATTTLPEVCSDSVPSGKQVYFVRTQNQPQIMQIDINPLDVEFGETQLVTVKARDTNDNPITQVNGKALLDNGSQSFSLALIDGTDLNGTWEGSWVLQDTYCTTYMLIITATSATGTSKVELAFK
ncbi:MAG: fibronectin type III domain-containing protein [Bacteroidales bacterium]|nr:fibronectin type III domain-containing protein [Bacteroidales bacterium]